jgi:hypothetical protein
MPSSSTVVRTSSQQLASNADVEGGVTFRLPSLSAGSTRKTNPTPNPTPCSQEEQNVKHFQ